MVLECIVAANTCILYLWVQNLLTIEKEALRIHVDRIAQFLAPRCPGNSILHHSALYL